MTLLTTAPRHMVFAIIIQPYKTIFSLRKERIPDMLSVGGAVLSEMQPNIIGTPSTSTFGSDIRKHDVLSTQDQLLSKTPVPSTSFQSFSPSFASESHELCIFTICKGINSIITGKKSDVSDKSCGLYKQALEIYRKRKNVKSK
ncbi:hypothetical protein FQA39_LY02230 [Lamprigera yunnana]|nr:hypothetical protein FQA39_LY02230 [Lamprigera yunnana]